MRSARTNSDRRLFTIPARREIAAIDRLGQELRLVVRPECADCGVGLDDRIPKLICLVAEHFFLFDPLDVDVLDRTLGRWIETHRPARRVEFDRGHAPDELDWPWIGALV